MSNTKLQLALRELRSDFGRPALWAALIGAGLILAFAGAFGTDQFMRPVPLAIYWIGATTLTFAAGSLSSGLVRRLMEQSPRSLRVCAMGAATGAVVSVVIFALNTTLFGQFLPDANATMVFVATTFGIGAIVTLVIEIAVAEQRRGESKKNPVSAPPPLLDRLPLEKRGPLVSISAVDHYVEITTINGTELVLMRLTDAITETAPENGLQIHRSHWVALTQIAEVKRNTGKGEVVLSNGTRLPVSRSNLPALKEAGLLAS